MDDARTDTIAVKVHTQPILKFSTRLGLIASFMTRATAAEQIRATKKTAPDRQVCNRKQGSSQDQSSWKRGTEQGFLAACHTTARINTVSES
jgi:hypothetical protein